MKMGDASDRRTSSHSLAALALGALGVVYGDIGTSPLYTVKEIFTGSGGIPLSQVNVVGVVSVIFWALMIVVSLKYVTLILRADNPAAPLKSCRGCAMACCWLVSSERPYFMVTE